MDGPALEALVDQIGAERILPVHTEKPEWFEARWGERVVRTNYGVAQRIGGIRNYLAGAPHFNHLTFRCPEHGYGPSSGGVWLLNSGRPGGFAPAS